MAITTDVIKIAIAVANCTPASVANKLFSEAMKYTTREEIIVAKIPIPEIGDADVPIRPAM